MLCKCKNERVSTGMEEGILKIMVAEYATGTGEGDNVLKEGTAMLKVLVESFTRAGHEVLYPTAGHLFPVGTGIRSDNFEMSIETLSDACDAALVVAPDHILGGLNRIIEVRTVNLGSSPGAVELCADKLLSSEVLAEGGIRVPETVAHGGKGRFAPGEKVVLKPRWGCGSEDTGLMNFSELPRIPEGFAATRYIDGDHLSVGLIAGEKMLPLGVNRQNMIMGRSITYDGNRVGIRTGRNAELVKVAEKCAGLLGCRGYVGVDMVLAEEPWVVDVNPRPTTAVFGLDKVLAGEIGELLLKARFGGLPGQVALEGEFQFYKKDL